MKKIFLNSLVIVFSFTSIHSQNWANLSSGTDLMIYCFYNDTVENLLYVGGDFLTAGNINTENIATWDGTSWDSLPGGGVYGGGWTKVETMLKYKEELYVGGFFAQAGNQQVNNLAKWNGISWQGLGTDIWQHYPPGNNLIVPGNIGCLYILDDFLYVGGTFDSIVGYNFPCNHIAKWDGNSWYSVPPFYTFSLITGLIEYKGDLIASGNFTNPVDTFKDIARLDGNQWVSLDGAVKGNGGVYALEVYKDELYIGGEFKEYEGNKGSFIMKWDGVNWSKVGGGLESTTPLSNGFVTDMEVFDDELWVVGHFKFAGNVPAKYIAKWDGIKWCGFGNEFNARIVGIGKYNHELHVYGGFDTIDNQQIKHIAKWTGGSYVDTCSTPTNISELEQQIDEIIIYPNPANSTLNISHSNTIVQTIKLFDQTGRLIKQIPENANQIDITGLPVGSYYIRMVGKDNVWTEKFVVIR